MRVLVDALLRPRNPDLGEEADRLGPRLRAAESPVEPQRLGDLVAHRVDRVQ